MVDAESSRLLAEVFDRMTYEQKNSVPPEIAERIGKFMVKNGYRLVFTRWYLQATPDAGGHPWHQEWQPIETAPTDGSAILVSNGRGVWVAKHKAIFQSGYKPDSPWFCLMLNKDHIPGKLRAGKPTHWMPIPDAPNE